MEFVWGESLEKRLEKAQSPLMERQVLEWSVQICDVLDYLHNRDPKVIFRDMKPSNVMVSNQGVVKLIDFGIARTYKEDKLQDTIALGSENYAAPEQWGEAQTDPRSDLYGLGATLYHLLANMPPSPAFLPSEPQRLDQMNGALSPTTVEIVTKAMARDREKRYGSAAEMKQALLNCLPGYVSPVLRPAEKARVGRRVPVDAGRQSSAASSAGPRPAAQTQIRRPVAAARRRKPAPSVRRRVRKVKVCPGCSHRNELAHRFCVRCGYAFQGVRTAVLRVVEPVRAAWEMPVHKSPLLLGRARREEGYRPDFDMTF
jgi:serine/threonine protein kinase